MPKVKILKYVGEYTPGEIVDVSDELAKTLCHVTHHHDGTQLQEHRKAMLLEDAEKLEASYLDPKVMKTMTQADFAKLGLKNVVTTPHDPQFEASLDAKRKADAKWLAEQESKSDDHSDGAFDDLEEADDEAADESPEGEVAAEAGESKNRKGSKKKGK